MTAEPTPGWGTYLQEFHDTRSGITERVLRRCTSDGIDPYTWCADAIRGRHGAERDEAVLDLACGSGPLAEHLPRWVGIDMSLGELAEAIARSRGPVLRGSADRLPVRDHAVVAAVCSMALQIIEPLDDVLSEASRVLRPGGRLVALVPATAPVPLRQLPRLVRLQLALRTRIAYPNDHALRARALRAAARRHSLSIVSDDRRAFDLRLRDREDADELLASLYLPSIPQRRLDAARAVLARYIGDHLVVPLRRLVLEANGAAR